jgi:hypothetical protein
MTPTVHVTSGAGAPITPGAVIPVSINVGGEIRKELNCVSIQVESAEQGSEIVINVITENTGNIEVTPAADIEILDTEQKEVIKTARQSLKAISPGAREESQLKISTSDLKTGANYWASVTIELDGQQICQKQIPFDVYEKGTESCLAILNAIQAPSFVSVSEEAEIIAMVDNTGDSPIDAKFIGVVTMDGNIVGNVESQIVSILPGMKGNLISYFTPKEEGIYVISGSIYYGIEKQNDCSEFKSVQITAIKAEQGSSIYSSSNCQNWYFKDWVIIAGISLIIILLIIVIIRLFTCKNQ